ncbi:MAG: molybdopterin synthase catalytic subunit [Pyrococcus sp.]|uniref:molybdenum cofactor biosynthesis protein MoaE n=1 Tax=Pyrococcus sp. TaxID=33866 RepID=UPI0025908CD5|nr:molybdenum cofactor biosynthesis protein MoaE [Pyrococcus sp.]MDK2869759.1 molybdopterin synthase catalytic subunit [Pyrococcus sp.]
MKKVRLVKKPEDFNLDEAVSLVSNPSVGAIVTFLGKVRNENAGREVLKLIYEAYEEMAEKEMGKIRREALEKFPIFDAVIWHRVGELDISENTILVVVSAKHRKEAFEACSWIVDEVKKRVPVWKREITTKGEFWIEGDKHIPAQ